MVRYSTVWVLIIYKNPYPPYWLEHLHCAAPEQLLPFPLSQIGVTGSPGNIPDSASSIRSEFGSLALSWSFWGFSKDSAQSSSTSPIGLCYWPPPWHPTFCQTTLSSKPPEEGGNGEVHYWVHGCWFDTAIIVTHQGWIVLCGEKGQNIASLYWLYRITIEITLRPLILTITFKTIFIASICIVSSIMSKVQHKLVKCLTYFMYFQNNWMKL